MGNPYVKVSDPNIIDLAAWQNLINTVNQHSDSIAKLTNQFGLGWTDPGSESTWSTVFDFGNQIIQYGRVKMDASNGETAKRQFGSTSQIYVYEEEVLFPNPFSYSPSVTATISRMDNSSSIGTDYNLTVSNTDTEKFLARVVNKDQTEIPSTRGWYLNWIAIGPYA